MISSPKEETHAKYYSNKRCPECNSSRIHRSRLRPGERSPSNWNLMPMRCRECKARFWVKNRDAYFVTVFITIFTLLIAAFIWIIISFDEISINGKNSDVFPFSSQSTINQLPEESVLNNSKSTIDASSTQVDISTNQSKLTQVQPETGDARHYTINLFLNKANEGNVEAQYQLGQLYLTGNGTLQDFEEAVKWFTLAAEQNYAPAQYELGLLYHLGQGVNMDNEKSYMWLNLSAATGLEQAALARDKVTRALSSKQLLQAQKAAREWLNSRKIKDSSTTPIPLPNHK